MQTRDRTSVFNTDAGPAVTEDVCSLTEVLRWARPFGGWRAPVPQPHACSHVTLPSAAWTPGGGGAWRRWSLAASFDPVRAVWHGSACVAHRLLLLLPSS